MYKILADDTLIYDSTLEDYKIGKGSVTLEVNKSGSFTFSIYPDHFYYDKFVRLKTVITVYKSGRIVFRGRILNDVTDYWNNKVITCEGELGFLQDSIIRPFSFEGTPAELFTKFVEEHNSQVDEFKRFKIGTITVEDPNDYISRSNTGYESALSNINSRLIESDTGGNFYITHGEDGTDPIPTINYLADFTKVSTQKIEFGSNLKNYTKTVKAEEIATAIIPLGTNVGSNDQRLTIADINDGMDYVYSETGVALYGWIFKTVVWEDVTIDHNLKTKAEEYLENVINHNITIELNAIDLHLLDRSIESFNVCDYVHVVSAPHNFDAVLLCNKQTLDLLKPENDTVVLGYQSSSFTDSSIYMASSIQTQEKVISSIKQDATSIKLSVQKLDEDIGSRIDQSIEGISLTVTNGKTSSLIELRSGEALISSQNITFNGFVTFEGLSGGTTTIDGACIKTGTIEADRLNLTGAITFGDLNSEVQNEINNRGISASRARTIITEELVSSPNIAGGKFWDLDQTTWLEMDTPNNSVAYLHQFASVYSDTDPICAIGYYTNGTSDEWVIAPFNNIRLGYSKTYDLMYANGDWDFSQATVEGLYLKFA